MPPPADRHDFPDCQGCPYVNPGQWTICVPCAAEQLSSIKDPCPICAQERRDGRCHNRLCTRPASSRHFEGITAITLHNDPLVDVMQRFKYRGKTGWAMIFARLLIGHLYETWDPEDVDLIIANPPNPGRNHTTLVIGHAATYDTADDWPFDDTYDPAIIKTTDTAQSAGKDLPGKESAALEHGNALVLRHPDRIDGSRVIVYDDICTTGFQLNAVAQRLRNWGAISVLGVVLARQPWSDSSNRSVATSIARGELIGVTTCPEASGRLLPPSTDGGSLDRNGSTMEAPLTRRDLGGCGTQVHSAARHAAAGAWLLRHRVQA